MQEESPLHYRHTELVKRLTKSGVEINSTLIPHKANIWHLSSALMCETGELFDPLKKWIIYNKELDMENIKEELGDIEFYLEGLRRAFGITREETLEQNIEKLTRRYGNDYSDKAAQERKDKE